ncbi:AP-4 complex accessory subunit RUSC1 isoform X3 [Gopherus flavomarginatus]|uniref:AP-4 complex accessory subunit RUSC1 isoform X3 n=1 Tax=Gopherus flavomarginatus TaxID=286002 RepID=UPI0021CC15A9|nr:AP-4 complex accessory subunit RUSC1 isoform X3 [Gopherus flavomarginatus]
MLSPKKGLLCNLNHIHLQHISLGLHLSRRPELQEGPVTMAPGDQTGCNDCQENCGALEQVDANSNNTSMQCRCCKSHPQQTPTLDLRNQPLLEDFPSLHTEEEVASPSDLASSSVSSCSDFSLDDTPVSVYCKAFPSEEALSPDNQPNIVPLEDAHDAPSLTDKGEPSDGRDANLNLQVQERPDPGARETPDSLCSSSLLDSASDDADSPSGGGQENMAEPLPTSICAELDSNCNALPALRIQPCGLSALAPGKWVPSLNSSVRAPPPVPPRAKRGLQVLNRSGVERPAPTEVPPGDQCRDATWKNITSFHELAQKRKRNMAGPPTPQARKDRSDWLIVFSPDKELPPPNELTCCSTLCLEPPGHQLQPDEQAKPPSCSQREVTTFKELRYRSAINKQKGQLAWEPGDRAAYQEQPEPQQAAMGRDVSSGSSRLQGPGGVLAPQLDGHLLALMESHQTRRQSRPGLQPITEGLPGDAKEGVRPLKGYVLRRKMPGSGCDKEALGWRLGGPEGDLWVSGKAQRGHRACKEVRHSQSFAGVPGAGQHWMANTDRAYDHLREQKKALLVGISGSVEKLIAHFSMARSLVQKTQLGDSWLSPDVSYLLLNTLCPALYALVADGLKPFQKDIIMGQRRSSPWSVVEASVKQGPGTRPLHSLYWQVSQLAHLRSSRQRFHAFILGLLNIKQLELWLSHLQKSSDVISVFYLPTAFFSLSHGPCPHLAHELLLLVQPLSVLTFHLDLLFEHHHLPMDVRPLPHRPDSPHSHPLGPALVAAPAQGRDPSDQAEGAESGASPEHQLPTNGPRKAALVGSEESARSQYSAAVIKSPPSIPAGVALKQTFQQVLQWGEQITQTLLGPECPAEPEKRQQPVPQDTGERRGSWWEQLSQTSEVYTTATKERFPFACWTKLRVAAGDTSSSLAAPPHGSGQASANEFGARGGEGASDTDLQLLKPRAGEGGAEAPGPTSSSEAGNLEAPHAEELPPQARTKGYAGPRETEPLEPSASKPCLPPSKDPAPDGSPLATPNLNVGGSPICPIWLGRLFGATCPPARGFPAYSDTSAAKSRRPSSWLPPSVNVLALVLKGGPSEKAWPQEQQEKKVSDSPQLHRVVRALCDHTGAGDDHLSFSRGDILQLLATVDEDWIRCCHGNNTGLVPVGYTSLIL